VAGGLVSHLQSATNAMKFNWMRSTEIVVMGVAGRPGATTGSVDAAVRLTPPPAGLRTLVTSLKPNPGPIASLRMPIYGLLLVVLMLVCPLGLFGTREAWDMWRKRKPTPAATEEGA